MPNAITWDGIKVVIDIIIALVTLAIIPAVRWIHTIKTNELSHIAADIKEIHAEQIRLGDKFDKHLEWHMNRDGR